MDGARIAIDHIAVTLPGEADGIDRALEAALVDRLVERLDDAVAAAREQT